MTHEERQRRLNFLAATGWQPKLLAAFFDVPESGVVNLPYGHPNVTESILDGFLQNTPSLVEAFLHVRERGCSISADEVLNDLDYCLSRLEKTVLKSPIGLLEEDKSYEAEIRRNMKDFTRLKGNET